MKKELSKTLEGLEALKHELLIDLMGFSELDETLYLRDDVARFLLSNGYNRAISLALHTAPSVYDLLLKQDDRGLLFYFTRHTRARAEILDKAADRIAVYLNDCGYKAFAVPGQGAAYPSETPRTILSHITQARLAGLGTMGDSGMLMSKEYGPRMRLATVVTDCPLPAGKPLEEDICTHCGLCAKACPSKAIYGAHFDPEHPDVLYTNKAACAARRDRNDKVLGSRFCNLCMGACPIGK